MDFEYSDEQKLLSETLRKFLNTGYSFDARAKIMAAATGYSEDVWAALGEMGILGVPFAAEHGGFGGNTVDMMVVMEALGEALVVEPYLATVGLGGQFVARAGSEAQQKRILPSLIQGKTKMAFGHLPAGGRYDLRHVGAKARAAGNGWVIDGEARMVLHGAAADHIVVAGRAAGADGDERGVSLFLVDRAASGVGVSEYRTLDNLRVADLTFAGVRVGPEALIGAAGEGFAVADEVIDYATALVCAEAVGAIKYAHDATLDYLKTRRQFGVPIGSFQALQHRMVDILISYEQAKSIACLACVKVDTADAGERRRVVSAAKIKIADACRHVSQEAVQLHGGMGMTEELKISHTFRRLTTIAQMFGDADHHLERFATLR
jgi:alkylation response protein AidB-like acyl-CoA dehydrogenase